MKICTSLKNQKEIFINIPFNENDKNSLTHCSLFDQMKVEICIFGSIDWILLSMHLLYNYCEYW